MSNISPVPYRIPMVDRQGLIVRSWQQFFEALLFRIGGVGNVATNDELQGETELSLGAQTATHIAELVRRLDDLQTTPQAVQAVAELLLSTPTPVFAPDDSLGVGPRAEPAAADFTLGYGPGGF